MLPKKLLSRHPILREFLLDQAPFVISLFVLGIAANYLQHGFMPGGDRPYPLAEVAVPLWHLLWLGFWTGYIMALVGEASGLLALPYSMSVLNFQTLAVTPTHLLITFLNPYGALMGFWRERRWNLDIALWLCLGTLVGSQAGPFIRVYFLSQPAPIKALIGAGLFYLGGHLMYEVTPRYLARRRDLTTFKAKFDAHVKKMLREGKNPSGIPEKAMIHTLERSWRRITISFWDESYTLCPPLLLLLGTGVGLVSSTIGVGGGFLMTPLLVKIYRLPMFVVVAASIPFVVVQSLVGFFAYNVTLPLLTGGYVNSEWGWGFLVASSAVMGAWCASKTQKFVPEHYLKLMLGILSGLGGLVYLLNYLIGLPFKI